MILYSDLLRAPFSLAEGFQESWLILYVRDVRGFTWGIKGDAVRNQSLGHAYAWFRNSVSTSFSVSGTYSFNYRDSICCYGTDSCRH